MYTCFTQAKKWCELLSYFTFGCFFRPLSLTWRQFQTIQEKHPGFKLATTFQSRRSTAVLHSHAFIWLLIQAGAQKTLNSKEQQDRQGKSFIYKWVTSFLMGDTIFHRAWQEKKIKKESSQNKGWITCWKPEGQREKLLKAILNGFVPFKQIISGILPLKRCYTETNITQVKVTFCGSVKMTHCSVQLNS